MPQLRAISAGTVGYAEASALQTSLADSRGAGEVGDTLLLLEHWPVYTKGRRSTPAELPMGEDWYRMQGIDVQMTDRGGQVTYHGPGQLVGYPIMDISEGGWGVKEYVALMERAMCETLDALDIQASPRDGLTGVWTVAAEPRKIGSIGIHVAGGVTTHGFAINVSNDLQPFEWIVPCGLEGARFTSVSRELGREHPMHEFSEIAAETFADVFGRVLLWGDASELPELQPLEPAR